MDFSQYSADQTIVIYLHGESVHSLHFFFCSDFLLKQLKDEKLPRSRSAEAHQMKYYVDVFLQEFQLFFLSLFSIHQEENRMKCFHIS